MRRFPPENMGPMDQWLRLSTGFVLLVLAGSGIVGGWGYVGIVPMLTAMFRWCPLYHLLGLHTGRRPGRSKR